MLSKTKGLSHVSKPVRVQDRLTFYEQVKPLRVLPQDLDGHLHHLGQRRIRLLVPLQVVRQIGRFKETWNNRTRRNGTLNPGK